MPSEMATKANKRREASICTYARVRSHNARAIHGSISAFGVFFTRFSHSHFLSLLINPFCIKTPANIRFRNTQENDEYRSESSSFNDRRQRCGGMYYFFTTLTTFIVAYLQKKNAMNACNDDVAAAAAAADDDDDDNLPPENSQTDGANDELWKRN
uniref:Uncharacterized protein n=1 Tax=Syphacia muris TaxID=451379 RepID=A0A0N5AVH3_9BILA